jgi:hypothetical protein
MDGGITTVTGTLCTPLISVCRGRRRKEKEGEGGGGRKEEGEEGGRRKEEGGRRKEEGEEGGSSEMIGSKCLGPKIARLKKVSEGRLRGGRDEEGGRRRAYPREKGEGGERRGGERRREEGEEGGEKRRGEGGRRGRRLGPDRRTSSNLDSTMKGGKGTKGREESKERKKGRKGRKERKERKGRKGRLALDLALVTSRGIQKISLPNALFKTRTHQSVHPPFRPLSMTLPFVPFTERLVLLPMHTVSFTGDLCHLIFPPPLFSQLSSFPFC